MNREIKFRGLRTDGKGWVYGFYSPVNVPILGTLGHCVNEDGYRAIDISIESLGQFTGLKDKNGKEIYEGDIVGISSPVGVITYDYCSFVFDWIDKHYITNRKPLEPLFRNIHLFQIFGNIHEHKHLLYASI